MKPSTRIWVGAAFLGLVVVVGTIGYVVIDGASWFDAFYMVLITVSTVGFGEVFVLGTLGRVWTVVIMLAGVGVLLYTSFAIFEFLLDVGARRWRKRTLRQVSALSDHVILCGFGRVGSGVFENLRRRHVPVVVVERDERAIEAAEEAGALVVEGDATHNHVLEDAGIQRARAVVASVTNDSDNLVIVLSARSLRPDVRIVSRASELEAEDKLRMAGADRVVAPQVVGSERLASLAVQPELSEFIDLVVAGREVEFVIEEIVVSDGSRVAGRTLRDSRIREESGALILAVQTRGGQRTVNPAPDHLFDPGTVVVAVGSRSQVNAAASLLGR